MKNRYFDLLKYFSYILLILVISLVSVKVRAELEAEAEKEKAMESTKSEMPEVSESKGKLMDEVKEKIMGEEAKSEIGEEQAQNIQALFTPGSAQVILDPQNNLTVTLSSLNFDFGKSMIKSEYFPLLTQMKKVAEMVPGRKIKVIGHTDSVGDNEFNQRLSQERARSVANYLEKELNMEDKHIETIGAGESEPIASNTTPEGRKLNRRIDIIFVSPY